MAETCKEAPAAVLQRQCKREPTRKQHEARSHDPMKMHGVDAQKEP
jgi:hypothetical protein